MNVNIFKGPADQVEREIATFLSRVTQIISVSQSGGGGSHEKICVTILWK